MRKMSLDDFIKYAKEQFDCEICLKHSDQPDTFESVFGASFFYDENNSEKVDGFENDLRYENISIDVEFSSSNGISMVYDSCVGLAA